MTISSREATNRFHRVAGSIMRPTKEPAAEENGFFRRECLKKTTTTIVGT
jgi:hypothetical protein